MTFAYRSIGSSPAGRRIWEAGLRRTRPMNPQPEERDIAPIVTDLVPLFERERRRRAKLHRVLKLVGKNRLEPLFAVPTIKEIVEEVAEKSGVTVLDILSHRRSQKVIHARHEVFWLARGRTKASLPQIGRVLGFDHTTVLHGIRCHEARMRGEKYIHPCRRKA